MSELPDFSQRKLIVKSRIEGAIREKSKRPSVYQYTLFFCLFFVTTLFTAIYMRTIYVRQRVLNSNLVNNYTLEQLLKSNKLDNETTIVLPSTISFSSPGESSLITSVKFSKGKYE